MPRPELREPLEAGDRLRDAPLVQLKLETDQGDTLCKPLEDLELPTLNIDLAKIGPTKTPNGHLQRENGHAERACSGFTAVDKGGVDVRLWHVQGSNRAFAPESGGQHGPVRMIPATCPKFGKHKRVGLKRHDACTCLEQRLGLLTDIGPHVKTERAWRQQPSIQVHVLVKPPVLRRP